MVEQPLLQIQFVLEVSFTFRAPPEFSASEIAQDYAYLPLQKQKCNLPLEILIFLNHGYVFECVYPFIDVAHKLLERVTVVSYVQHGSPDRIRQVGPLQSVAPRHV